MLAAQRPANGSFDAGSDIGDIGLDSYKHAQCAGASLATSPDGRLAIAAWPVRIADTRGCHAIETTTLTR